MNIFRRKRPALEEGERKTQELEARVDEQTARVQRLQSIGTVITVRARQGKARSA